MPGRLARARRIGATVGMPNYFGFQFGWDYQVMEHVVDLLGSPADALVTAVLVAMVAGMFTLLGARLTSLATRAAAREQADAQVAVAQAQRATTLAAAVTEDRVALSRELVGLVEAREAETRDSRAHTWDELVEVKEQSGRGEQLVRRMDLVFDASVVAAAQTALSASQAAARRHIEHASISREDDEEQYKQRELARIKALREAHGAIRSFTKEAGRAIVGT